MNLIIPMDSNRPTRAEVRINALYRNFSIIKNLAGSAKIMAIVKADAYGHGLLRMAQEFEKLGAAYLGVALVEEGVFLRKNNISLPILVLGPLAQHQISDFITYNLDVTVPSLEKARAISEEALQLGRTARIHIKIDTGMGRIGMQWNRNVIETIKTIIALPQLSLEGIFSHFACADTNPAVTNEQIARFSNIIAECKRIIDKPFLAHIANSAGLIQYPHALFDMVRPGIALYGYNPVPENSLKLEPVLRLMSRVAYFKVVDAGISISYGHTYTVSQPTRIVTIPIGYADGYSRCFSNRAPVIIRGKTYTVTGIVCMDQLMVDIGPDGTAYNGDDVLLFGIKNGDAIQLETLCTIAQTIPYELLCRISSRVPRIYVDE
ncbi:MAG TPA: alanine racemase [Spirochaetia bacterium]|nr:alanine racemase [Spirochaetales bacterium]HPD81223.1 alanine racemase [Spirochaetales bacterium]HQK33225.1 alanine racemase [Spirochaetales bacterium]HRS65830.1 alanine racemase [Spirochaetia bacterium]